MRNLLMIGLLVVLVGCQKAPTVPDTTLQARSGVILPGGGDDYVRFLDARDMVALGIIQAPSTDKVDLPWKPGQAQLQDVTISCSDIFQTLEALGIVDIPDGVSSYFDCRLDGDRQLPPSFLTIGALAGYGTSYQGFAGVAAGGAVGIIAWGRDNAVEDPISVSLNILVGGNFERSLGGSFSFGNVAEVAWGAAAFLRIPPRPVGIQISGRYLFSVGSGGVVGPYGLTLSFQGKWSDDGSFELKPVAFQKPVDLLN